jgi:hypothetical protein
MVALHGEAGDSDLMRFLLQATGWADELCRHGIDLLFLDAPHSRPAWPERYQNLVARGFYLPEKSYHGWGLTDLAIGEDARTKRVEESIASVEHGIACLTPVHGICGFCDGATIAAVVAMRSTSLTMLINMCSGPFERLPDELQNWGIAAPPQLSSLHLLGMKDETFSMDELLTTPWRFPEGVICHHPGGHGVPLLTRKMRSNLKGFLLSTGMAPVEEHECIQTELGEESAAGTEGSQFDSMSLFNKAFDSMSLFNKVTGERNIVKLNLYVIPPHVVQRAGPCLALDRSLLSCLLVADTVSQ